VLCSCLHRFGCWLSWLAPFALRFLAPPFPLPLLTYLPLHPRRGNSFWLGGLGAGKRVCLSCPCVWYSRTWLIKRLFLRYELGKGNRLFMCGRGCGGEIKTSSVVARVVVMRSSTFQSFIAWNQMFKCMKVCTC
jgi:hypothetical protein